MMPLAPTLVRLLQLASPALPIGAYSYSQGLEWAIEAGTVHDAVSAQSWIGDVLAGMLRGLGATVNRIAAPFEPEAGAYAAGHHAHSGDAKHAGIIHDFAARRPDR